MDSLPFHVPKHPITTQLLTDHHPITASRTLGNPETAKEYWYNTTDVYTFDYFQSVLLFDEYCLDIGIVKLRLDRHLNGNPICIMAKHTDGRYVYNFEIFHECLLPKSDQAPPGYGA